MLARSQKIRRLIGSLAALALTLGVVPIVLADVGIASFDPTSVGAGDSVRVSLEGCTFPADAVRIALARAGEATADESTDVVAVDAGAVGDFVIETPGDLAPGEYVVMAACPRDGVFGLWGSEVNLVIVPDTSTAVGVATPLEGPSTALIVLVVAAIAGVGLWLRRAADAHPRAP